jgi:hypothetical protein
LRKLLKESMALIDAGKDPVGVIRDPAEQRIRFPHKSAMMAQRHDGVSYGTGLREGVAAE